MIPDGRLTTRTFEEGEFDEAGKWIDKRQGHENIYFHVNALRPGLRDRKAKKEDIAEARYLHVDIDDLSVLPSLQRFAPRPTAVVCTGGGFQPYWRLSSPSTDLDLVEKLNTELETGSVATNVRTSPASCACRAR